MATPTTAARETGANPAPFASCRLPRARRLGVWALAVVFTLLAVHWSERNGRLAQDSTYDDVGYMADAVNRLQTLDTGGVAALTGDLAHHPPHSPFSTLLALTSFETLGLSDWPPYVFVGAADLRHGRAGVDMRRKSMVPNRPSWRAALPGGGKCRLP